ncbi:hypothetical protein DFH07DRAFT_780341 [Mycena maculata]|uniref:Uncharacterized protein n=1 Tax=Mycena maculata TaxID=230809 RepID=A0AAD7MWX9_9AGAR|nr:hypothetical protein DFH07DRAFT_780341 [Mycena maculata]
MDSFYDNIAAKKCVEMWAGIMESLSGQNGNTPAASVDLTKISVKKREDGQFAKIMLPGEDHRIEGLFSIVGVLKDFELPPVKKDSIHGNRVHFARQHTSITGYDLPGFKDVMSNIQEMMYKMSLKFEADQMLPWVCDPCDGTHGQVISSNSRYFTIGRHIPESARCPFDKRVDPAGVLAKLETDTIVHCHDNDVAYLQLKDTRLSWPGIDQRKQEAYIARTNAKQAHASSSRTTIINSMSKRVRVYDDDESDDDIPSARKRFEQMRVDDSE